MISLFAFLLLTAHAAEPEAVPAPDEHVQYWIRTVQSNPLELVRKNAGRVLGGMGDRAAVPALIAALKDSSAGVRAEAAKSLGLLGDERAVAPLQEVADNDSDAQSHRAARDAIERIRAYQEFQKKKQEKLNK